MPEKSNFPRTQRPWQKYKWEEWADGEARKFTKGEDFQVAPYQFIVACRRFCERKGRNWTVESVVEGNDVFLSISKPKRKLVRKVVKK